MYSNSQKIYNYNCTRNEFFLNNIKMKRKKEDIEKLLLSILYFNIDDYLKEEITKEVKFNNKNLQGSNSEQNLKTVYKLKNQYILKQKEANNNSMLSQTKIINNSEKKNERVDFKNLHNLIDDIQLNFNNTTRENEDLILKENRNSIENLNAYKGKNSKKISEINESFPIIHEQHIKNMMNASLYPESLSRSFELELFKKYLGKIKQEKYKENIRCHNVNNNMPNIKEKTQLHFNQNFKKKKKENIVNLASNLSSFAKNLNKELGRFSNLYGKDNSLDRFQIGKNLHKIYEEQDNIIAYRSKKINNDIKPDKKLKLKPLIVRNSSSIERLADNMFRYTIKLKSIRKLNNEIKNL